MSGSSPDENRCESCGGQLVFHADVFACCRCDCADQWVGHEYGLCMHAKEDGGPCPPIHHDHIWEGPQGAAFLSCKCGEKRKREDTAQGGSE